MEFGEIAICAEWRRRLSHASAVYFQRRSQTYRLVSGQPVTGYWLVRVSLDFKVVQGWRQASRTEEQRCQKVGLELNIEIYGGPPAMTKRGTPGTIAGEKGTSCLSCPASTLAAWQVAARRAYSHAMAFHVIYQ